MSLIIALGSNVGDSKLTFKHAQQHIHSLYPILATSSIYRSAAIEYIDQPDFFNMAIECQLPALHPDQVMNDLLKIEALLGRKRDISKGPRTIDIDIIFWGNKTYKSKIVSIPHPAWQDRSFVVKPILELPYATTLMQYFNFPQQFTNSATQIKT